HEPLVGSHLLQRRIQLQRIQVSAQPTDDERVHSTRHATNGHMRFGYFMMPMHPPGSDVSLTLETDLAQIEHLDRLGFHEAWIGEHFTAEWENIPAPDIFIGAALQRTRSIKL